MVTGLHDLGLQLSPMHTQMLFRTAGEGYCCPQWQVGNSHISQSFFALLLCHLKPWLLKVLMFGSTLCAGFLYTTSGSSRADVQSPGAAYPAQPAVPQAAAADRVAGGPPASAADVQGSETSPATISGAQTPNQPQQQTEASPALQAPNQAPAPQQQQQQLPLQPDQNQIQQQPAASTSSSQAAPTQGLDAPGAASGPPSSSGSTDGSTGAGSPPPATSPGSGTSAPGSNGSAPVGSAAPEIEDEKRTARKRKKGRLRELEEVREHTAVLVCPLLFSSLPACFIATFYTQNTALNAGIAALIGSLRVTQTHLM